jgi:hypothetical protein
VYHPRGSKGSATVPAQRTSGEKPSVAFADENVFTLSVAAFVVARNGREV